jgi:hypothetical protein
LTTFSHLTVSLSIAFALSVKRLVEGKLRRLAEVKEKEGASTKYQSCPQ